jgi:hypothetical protein
MAKKSLTEIVPLQVRMPEELRRRLAKAALENARSLNGEIVWRLKQSLAVPEAQMTWAEKFSQGMDYLERGAQLLRQAGPIEFEEITKEDFEKHRKGKKP